MKNKFVLLIVSVLCFSFAAAVAPVFALEGQATISAKDLYSLSQRKTYRLGLRGGIISPTDNINVNKDSTFDVGLEFDAKLNENVDSGPRFGVISKKLKVGTTVDANYTALKFGFGGRLYTMFWGETGSSHGFFNLYLNGEVDYFAVSKAGDVTSLVTNPSTFAGLGGYGGVGVELAFGPNSGGYVEAGYQKTSIKSAANDEFPLDGYVVAAGARLAFF